MDEVAARARFDDDQRLQFWLSEMYRAHVLGVGNAANTTRLARNTLDSDQRLGEAAKRKLAELQPICAMRDQKSAYVEHKTLDMLKKLTEKEVSNG